MNYSWAPGPNLSQYTGNDAIKPLLSDIQDVSAGMAIYVRPPGPSSFISNGKSLPRVPSSLLYKWPSHLYIYDIYINPSDI
jgi:hypothetical protein